MTTPLSPEVQQALKEHMRKLAAKGGKNTVKKHGTKYMSDLVKKRWAKKKSEAGDK
jgi:hypothetical protein